MRHLLVILLCAVPLVSGIITPLSSVRAWRVGETNDITWNSTDTTGAIDITLVGTVEGAYVVSTGVADTGSVEYTIPSSVTPGNYYLSFTQDGSVYESGVFSVNPAVVNLMDSKDFSDASVEMEFRQYTFDVYATGELTFTLETSDEATLYLERPGSGVVTAGAEWSHLFPSGMNTFVVTAPEAGLYRLAVVATGTASYSVQALLTTYTLEFTSPITGGRKVRPGINKVTWRSGNIPGNVLLELNAPEGGATTQIASFVPNSGTYDWSVSGIDPGTGYTITMTYLGDTSVCCGGSTLTVTSEAFDIVPTDMTLAPGTPVSDGARFLAYANYIFEVPTEAKVTITVTPVGTDNVDLFVGINRPLTSSSRPTSLNNEADSRNPTGPETVVVDIAPTTATDTRYYISVQGLGSAAKTDLFTVEVTVDTAAVLPSMQLTEGRASMSLGGPTLFVYDSTQRIGFQYVNVLATGGNPDVFVQKNSLPSESNYRAKGNATGSDAVEVQSSFGRFLIDVTCAGPCSFDIVVFHSSIARTLGSPGNVLNPPAFSSVVVGNAFTLRWTRLSTVPGAVVTIELVSGVNPAAVVQADVPDVGSFEWAVPETQPIVSANRIVLRAGTTTRTSSLFSFAAPPGAVECTEDCEGEASGGGMSAGLIAGIILSVLAGIFLIVSAVYFLKIKKNEDKKDDVARRASMRASRLMEFDNAAKAVDGDELVNVPGFTSLEDAQSAKRQSMIPDEFVKNARKTGLHVDRQTDASAPAVPQRQSSVTFATFDVGDVVDQQTGTTPAAAAEKPSWAAGASANDW